MHARGADAGDRTALDLVGGVRGPAHVPLARKAGLADPDIAAIGAGTVPQSVDRRLRCAVELAMALLANHGVEDSHFAEARKTLGERLVVDIVGLLGFFSTTCLLLNLAGLTGDAPFPPAADSYSPADKSWRGSEP
jgi:hypothetical protein